jgi:hypothetical protein
LFKIFLKVPKLVILNISLYDINWFNSLHPLGSAWIIIQVMMKEIPRLARDDMAFFRGERGKRFARGKSFSPLSIQPQHLVNPEWNAVK